MCGITGVISKTNAGSIKDTVFSMSQAIKHRGPDGEGFAFFSFDKSIPVYSEETPKANKESSRFIFNPSTSLQNLNDDFKMAFGHRRLSIIDLSEGGHQPMCDTTRSFWITFNGEIYNYIELREELKLKGHHFVTQSDTEVIIEAFKEWGIDCVQRFNGMFAFALFDKTNNRLFCVRDRAGVKPFYFINTENTFAFASEYKAFIKSGLVPFEINEAQQFDFVVNGNLENSEQSLFKGIYELKPSHFLIYDLNKHSYKVTKFYDLPKELFNEDEVISKIEKKLVNAIHLRLRSDVEIGSCLSGGLDSSIIAGIASHLQPGRPMKLFTAIFPQEVYDESVYAREVANSVAGKWQTVSPTADEFFRDIESLNYFQDLPVWSTSTYSQHRVMKLASENDVKVVLDGQGADELFGGYSHHFMALWKEDLGLNTFIKMNQAGDAIPHGYKFFGKQLIKDAFGISFDYSNYFLDQHKHFGKSKNEKLSSTLNEQLSIDYFGRLKSYLKCEDRCSMAFGVESRVPFADDVDLVNYMFSIEGKKKIQKGISKYLLREAAKNYIPNRIYNRRDKIGFETPVQKWLNPNKRIIVETIDQQLDFVKMDYLNFHFDSLLARKPGFILRLYSLAIWKKVFSTS